MEKTISTNQACLILCVFTISLKLSALPAIMFSYAGNDGYISCLIALAFDFIGAIIIINIMHKHPDKTFFQLITERLGKVIAIIIHSLLLLYFLMKCILILQELHDYFIATLFEELNPIFFIIVLGLLIMFSASKNFRTIGRMIQLIFWPTVVTISFSLIFPINDLQIEKLLPIFEQGFNPIYLGISRTTFAFGDFMILLPMMGHITFEKNSKKKLLIYMSSTLSFVLNFFIIFIGSFGDFSGSQTLALSELPLHNTTPATIGKLEWLTLTIWTIILLVDAEIVSIASRTVFDTIFQRNDKKLGVVVTTGIVILAVTFTYLQLETLLEVIISPAFASTVGAVQSLMIIIIVLANTIKKNRPNEPPRQKTKTTLKKRKMQC